MSLGRTVAHCLVLGWVVSGAGLALTGAQQAVFRTRTDLVQVDLVVTDAAGRPVHGLTKADFQLLDRGRAQAVEFADEVTHERPLASGVSAAIERELADNAVAAFERVVVLILDDLHFQGKTEEVKRIARRMVDDLAPGASMALVTTSGVFGIEPTADRVHLLRELDRFVDKFDPEGRRLADGRLAPVPALGKGPPDLARFFGDMTQYRTLQDIARMLGSADTRRKVFIWISGGNAGASTEPVGRSSSANDDKYLGALAGLLESLRRSNITTYSIATGDFSQRLLQKVSETTGGFVTSLANFDEDLSRIAQDLDHYYLLGFYPSDRRGTGFREITVTVNRPGLLVRHRRGYHPGEPPKPPGNRSQLAQLSGGVLPKTELPLRLLAVPVALGNKPGLAVALEVRSERASVLESDGIARDTLKYEIWAVDLQKKKPVKSVAREVRVSLQPTESSASAIAYQVHAGLELLPGRYQIRASAISSKEGKGGSVYLQTEILPVTTSQARITGLIIAYDSGPRAPRAGQALVAFPVVPTHDRDFDRQDVLRLSYHVSGVAEGTTSFVEVLGADGRQVLEQSHVIADGQVSVPVRLSDLEPGSYRLRVSLLDASAAAARRLDFTVR